MSSCPPIRCGSPRAVALVVLAVVLALLCAPAAAAQPPLVVAPDATADGQVRLVVQVPDGAGGPLRPEAFSASVDGVPQPVTAEPVLSDRLAMALVVDASADGSAVLPAGLGGAANFVLAAPPSTRSALITDSTPPTVAVPWPSGQVDTVRGLSAVRSGGARSTAAALDLAVAQLPTAAIEPRLVVLYTGAPDAGGEPASAIVERMRSAGVVLAVVGPTSPFWTTAAADTGGVAVTTEPADAIGAFEEVSSALGRSHVLTFPTPARLPATAVVRVETASGPLVGEVAVPPETGSSGSFGVVAIGMAAAAVLAVGVLVLLRRRARRGERSSTHQVWAVPDRLEAAVDRTAVLHELATALRGGRPVWLRPHPDMAGLGTTTVMIEFAHRYRERYDVIWWVSALDPDLVPDRLAELAETLGLAATTDPADEATATLLKALRHRRRWLLIFDDVGAPHDLARYLPDGPGDVVVAASDERWGELASQVAVPAFTRAESVRLLRAGRPDLPLERADEIASTLGDLPLSVGPAAALLTDTGTDALRALPRGRPEAVWELTLDRLAADDPQALTLLTLVAWLGPAPMPLSLLTENPHELPEPLDAAARTPSELVDHAATLRRRGLARVTKNDVWLHQVPAELLMARTGHEHGDDGGWTAIAVRLLRSALPDAPASEPDVWPIWRRLLPHVLAATDPARKLDVVDEEVGWLLGHAGDYLQARGRANAARALHEDAHEFDVSARLRAVGGSS